MRGFLHNLAAKSRGDVPRLAPRKPAPFETGQQGWSSVEDIGEAPVAVQSATPDVVAPEILAENYRGDVSQKPDAPLDLAGGDTSRPAPLETLDGSPSQLDGEPFLSEIETFPPSVLPPSVQVPLPVGLKVVDPVVDVEEQREPTRGPVSLMQNTVLSTPSPKGRKPASDGSVGPSVESDQHTAPLRDQVSAVSETVPMVVAPVVPPLAKVDNLVDAQLSANEEAGQTADTVSVVPAVLNAEQTIRAPRRSADRVQVKGQTQPSQPTVVEVTIGSIDVQSDTPAAPPQAVAEPASRSLSLDAFLASEAK